MRAILAFLLLIFSASAFSANNCTWVFIDGVETCTHAEPPSIAPPPAQRTISGTYTMPVLQQGVVAVNMYITVSGWDQATQSYSAPLNYVLPVTGSYSIQVPSAVEYQFEAHYGVNDGMLSPNSPLIPIW